MKKLTGNIFRTFPALWVTLIGLAALIVAGCSNTGETAATGFSTASASTASPVVLVQTIVLPHDEPDMPVGPGRDVYLASCVSCHSPRYVVMQPLFPRKVWTSEVNKMSKVFKAHITPAQSAVIINYLTVTHGKSSSPEPAKSPALPGAAHPKGGANGDNNVS